MRSGVPDHSAVVASANSISFAALVHRVGHLRVVHLVEAVLVVLAALQQVMHGHGAAAALAVGKDRRGAGQRVGGVRVSTLKAILIDLGSMNKVPLVSGMRQTLKVAEKKKLSKLGKYVPCGQVGVAGFQLVVQALHQLILCSGRNYLMLLYM